MVSCRIVYVALITAAFAISALAAPSKHHNQRGPAITKEIRHDPAFRKGFNDGYRQGANDSEALSNVYKDEVGPLYEQASDGYIPEYGDLASYQKLFRLGYVDGYKDGWDFNAGQYTPFGAGGGGP